MQLVSLEANNFRSLENICLKFEKLAILIGENDAGKSSTLDLLEIALSNKRPDDNDFFCCEEEIIANGEKVTCKHQADEIRLILEFKLDADDDQARLFAINDFLRVLKVWKKETYETFFWGSLNEDSKLAKDFSKLKKAELEEIIHDIDPTELPNLKTNEDRIKWLIQKAAEAPKKQQWILAPARWGEFLPRFERYRAMDYTSPENLVMKTLKQVYEQCIYQETEENGQVIRNLDKRLSDVRNEAEAKIRDRVQELRDFINRYSPRIKNISFDPLIDFTGGLKSGEFQLDDGQGLHYLSKVGDGTKRRISMATLDWDRQVSLQQAARGGNLPSIIRGYDEPDTNLHYEAQRLMYRAISDIAEAPNSHIQILVCTHSLTMIDRAPAKCINLLRIREGRTNVERLETNDDPNIELFLTELAQELGITNTIMFYERCFILIEGETELNALPSLYRTLYKHSILEDGIRIINVKGNGASKEFLKLMSKNKQALTVIFLDKDTETEQNGKTAKLTRQVLKEAGFTQDFINERLIYIGTKEFEDAFSDEVLARALHHGYHKAEGIWSADDITQLRNEKKISDALGRVVNQQAGQDCPNWGKPELGRSIGRVCRGDEIPQEIVNLFTIGRQICGCN
jgi:putative ATP-dependent endonuclease of the OLD family